MLKMNPVNEYLGPFLERAFAPLIERGFLAHRVRRRDEVGATSCQPPAGRRHPHHRLRQDPRPASSGARRGRSARRASATRSAAQEAHHQRARQREPGDRRARAVLATTSSRSMARNVAAHGRQQRLVQLQRRQAAGQPKGCPASATASSTKSRARSAEVPPRKAYYPGAQERFQLAGRRPERGEEDRRRRAGRAALDARHRPRRQQHRGRATFYTEPFCSILSRDRARQQRPAGVPRRGGRVRATIDSGAR